MSEARYGNMHVFRFIILVFIFLIVGMLTATIQAHAVSPWHEVELTPGQTYDVSTAKTNTTVYINKAGDYTLKGESTKCRVVIQSGGVNVYLADGLEIDPGIGAYVGSRTAAITVNDMNGTVKLISKPGADIYFGGYLTAPAVRKYGYNSKLVFETADPANPGTITAYRSHGSNSAGIGSAYEFSGRVSTGNIEINSGNINATGGYMSAGIGGGGNGNAYYITINGGNVRAVGGTHGTGLGGGFHGNASNITINGGTVNAESIGEGAGIGSGEQSKYAKNIIINGGKITAKSDLGAGIGGGQRSEVENLRINGGTVNASSRETAIGGSADQHFGDVKSLYITGGKITAKAGHVGIGASGSAPGPNNIYISGGDITATSDYYAIGGGGFNGALDDDRITNVTISGGTIKADGGKDDIGTNSVWMDEFNVTICGGSVNVDPDKILLLPKGTYVRDQMNNQVNKTVVKLDGLLGMTSITDANVTKISNTYPDYGLKDVRTDNNGTLYFWIPEGTEVTAASVENNRYQGSIASQTEGILYPAPDTYQVHFLKRELGFDESIPKEDIVYSQDFVIDKSDKLKKMSEMGTVTPQEGKVFVGWQRSKVFGASLYPDEAEVCNFYSYDSQKNKIIEYRMMPKWIEEGSAMISVNVDNMPAEANGIKLLRNDMEYDKVFVKSGTDKGVYTYDASIGELENGEYEIWIRFDAEGDYIKANKTITIGGQNNLVTVDFYTICFNGNGADSGTTEALICAYDQTCELPVCEFQKSEYHFIGWNLLIDGTGVYYKPGEAVKNLYSETNGNVVLYAIWEHDYYTIKYDANGGEGQVPDVQVWTEEEYMLSNPGFIKQDHALIGWNTEADGSGKTYVLDEKVKDMADAGESIVLYAQWEYDPEASGDESGNDEKGAPGVADNDRDEEAGTGDRMPIGLIAGIMLAVFSAMVAVLFGRRRRTE